MSKLSRRGFLRGSLQGAAVGMALPFLNCFLSESGKAMAATGQRIPVRFGSWIWGCGFIPELWVPEQTGSGYTMPAHLKPVEKLSRQANLAQRIRCEAGWRSEQASYHRVLRFAYRDSGT